MPAATLGRLTTPSGPIERVAHGVYRLRGAPGPGLLDLRAAWLQLAPDVPAWRRTAAEGIVSHRSAAAVLWLGDLPADRHEFTVSHRRQTRRRDVRLHVRPLSGEDWTISDGMLVTRLHRLAADLLAGNEDPSAVATIIADGLDRGLAPAASVARTIAPFARRFGRPALDGAALVGYLLDSVGIDPTLHLTRIG